MFKKETIKFGEGFLYKWTIFEHKKFLSIYFHRFYTEKQDRFHTHAFNAIAIVLWGGYTEEYIKGENVYTKVVRPGVRFIGRSYNHRLMRSIPGTASIVIGGAWAKSWLETKDGIVRKLTWGRKYDLRSDQNPQERGVG